MESREVSPERPSSTQSFVSQALGQSNVQAGSWPCRRELLEPVHDSTLNFTITKVGRGQEIGTVDFEMAIQFLRRKITKDQSRDTGMAMVLLFMLIAASRKKEGYLFVAMIL